LIENFPEFKLIDYGFAIIGTLISLLMIQLGFFSESATMNIAITPAQGGSKRIPEKNIRPFYGKPIIDYSIEAAQQTVLF